MPSVHGFENDALPPARAPASPSRSVTIWLNEELTDHAHRGRPLPHARKEIQADIRTWRFPGVVTNAMLIILFKV